MSTESYLKKQNAPYLWTFFIFNAVVFLLLFFVTYFETIINDYKAMLTLRSSGILIAPLILFIICGLLSANQKAVIVFWRFKNPLPGSRAFTVYGLKDSRIDMVQITNTYNPLPSTPESQNALWYKLFKKNEKNIIIQKSHKDFLLARDLVAICFLYIICAALPMLFLGKWPLNLYYFSFLVVEYLILVRVAQNHGRSFVCNVLAIESAKEI
jgi:hypothetical protein